MKEQANSGIIFGKAMKAAVLPALRARFWGFRGLRLGFGVGFFRKFHVIWNILKSISTDLPEKVDAEWGALLLTDKERQSHLAVSSSLKDMFQLPSFHSAFTF